MNSTKPANVEALKYDEHEFTDEDDYEIESNHYSKLDYMNFSEESFDMGAGKRKLQEYKKGENGFYIIERRSKKGKLEYFEFYETAVFPKTTIRNAITGEKYRGYYVGSNDENLFFKVMNSTAETKNKDPYLLFYDNPEQWERHNKQTCPLNIKEKWNNKFQHEMKRKKQPQFIRLLQEQEKMERIVNAQEASPH